MLAQSHARKPAPPLAARGMWLRLHGGPDAFGSAVGSALGDAVVGSIQRADSQKTPAISENGDGAVARSELRYGKPDSTRFDLPNIDPNMPFGPSDDAAVNQRLAELDSNLNPSPTLDDDELLAAGLGYPGLGKRSATSIDVRGGANTFGKFPSVGPEMTPFQKGFAKATLDMPFALYNAAVGTAEAGMNLMSGALPGFPDYVPVLDPIRAPYLNPDVSEYTEFGFGLLGAGLARSRSVGTLSERPVSSLMGPNDGPQLPAGYMRPNDGPQLPVGYMGANEGPQLPTVKLVNGEATPAVPYNRREHYGNTPSAADRRALGLGPDQVADHNPPLVVRYYQGDAATGEKPGYLMPQTERRTSANDRSRMLPQPKTDSNAQGAEMAKFSKEQKKAYGLK